MDEEVAGQNGRKEPKIAIARRAALDLVEQFATYARAHPGEPVLLGIYEFSRRRGEPDCRPIVPMGPPDRERATEAIARLNADGGTPIGQAMITAKRALDDTGLLRRHLLVVTDGENTDGVATRDRGPRHRQASGRRAAVDSTLSRSTSRRTASHASATPAASSSRPRTRPS